MKIAFTSCFHPFNGKAQNVWDRIHQERPDVLLLLGDAVYLDADGVSTTNLLTMTEPDFAQRGLDLYRAQLAQPQFKALYEDANIQTHAIWDDHDFLGNGSNGADLNAIPSIKPKVQMSSALFAAFRNAVETKASQSFPTTISDPRLSTPTTIGYRMVSLDGTSCHLHLTDGRSFRQNVGGREMLGANQRQAIAINIQNHPQDLHLIASGSTFGQGGDRWQKYPTDAAWLLGLAAQFKCLMLSGDIHDNDFQTYATTTTGYPLHDATASGAAIRKLVGFGKRLENYGILEITHAALTVTLHTLESVAASFRINAASWQVQ